MRDNIVTGVIIKPASNTCNLRCSYCYANARKPTPADMMPIELAKKVIKETLIQPRLKQVDFIWHGGEPLLRGIPFYREVFAYQRSITPAKIEVRHGLQTNMTLISEDWLSFLKEWNVNISTSLDGPEQIHNAARHNRKGHGTYSIIRKKIDRARAKGVQVNTISVITNESAAHAAAIYEHFVELGIGNIALLPCYILGSNSKPVPPTITSGVFGGFLCEVFDIYTSNPNYPNVREFQQNFQFFTNDCPSLCNFSGTCHRFICVNSDGNVYSCDTSPASKEFRFGNLLVSSLKEVLGSQLRRRAIRRTEDVADKCRLCRYWKGCHGGCPNQRPDGHFYFCKDRKLIYAYIESKLADIVDQIEPLNCVTPHP